MGGILRWLKNAVLVLAVFFVCVFIVKAGSAKCPTSDDECRQVMGFEAIGMTVVTVFLWGRLSRKFDL